MNIIVRTSTFNSRTLAHWMSLPLTWFQLLAYENENEYETISHTCVFPILLRSLPTLQVTFKIWNLPHSQTHRIFFYFIHWRQQLNHNRNRFNLNLTKLLTVHTTETTKYSTTYTHTLTHSVSTINMENTAFSSAQFTQISRNSCIQREKKACALFSRMWSLTTVYFMRFFNVNIM